MGKSIEELKKRYPLCHVERVSACDAYTHFIDLPNNTYELNGDFTKTLKELNLPIGWVRHYERSPEGMNNTYRVWVLDSSPEPDWREEVANALEYVTFKGTRLGQDVLYRLPDSNEPVNVAFGKKLINWYKQNSCSYVVLFGAEVDGRDLEVMPIVIKKRTNPD